MPLTLKGTGAVLITDDVQEYVDRKVEKISLMLATDESAHAEVELATTGGARTGEQFRAEFNVSFAGGFVRAEATCQTLHAAIDQAGDEARAEVKKHRTKHRDLIRKGSAKIKDFVRYWRGS